MNLLRWTDPNLKRITSLYLVKTVDDRYEIHYRVGDCTGETQDNEKVLVMLPFTRLPALYLSAIVRYAKRAGVYAKGLGILDNITLTN